MKATALLKKDHAAVKKLLTDFGRTTSRAARKRQELIDRIAKELEIHSKIEEEIFYPAVKEVPEGRSLVKEAESEHKEVDSLIAEGQGFIRSYPWLTLLPGIMIATALMSFTFLGDGLRDALDPKLKGKQ